LSGYVNSQDNLFSGQIFDTGSRLDNKINSLSGYVNSQDVIFSGQTFNTGSRLNSKINSLSGYVDSKSITLPSTIVYTTGDQTISGVKTFDSYINLNSDLYSQADIYANIVQLNNIRDQFDENTNIYLTDNKITLIPFSSYVGITGNLEVSNNVYAKNLVYTTSNQTISGIKTFTSRPTVNGTGVLLIGEASPIALPSTIVYTTGDQIISGNKTFINNIAVSGTGDFNSVKVSNIDKLFLSGIDILITGNSSINIYNPIYISGNPVLTGTIPTAQTISNVVYTTGDQTISGIKTFTETGSFDTLQITNKKLSSYNYLNSNFTFDNIYINIVNSSNNVIGTLPSNITSGINYYVKNLNTGVLLITGSGERTIDGFSNVNLYKNESLQLLGVNNVGYTGWITVGEGIGVS
jgi:hypothetical protein